MKTIAKRKDAPVLAHIHVPKCSGNSIMTMLDGIFGRDHVRLYFDHSTTFVYRDKALANLVRHGQVKAFSSHFVRRFPPELAGRPMLYVTFLREPVQQFISYITYTKKHYANIKDPILLRHLPPEMPRLSTRECACWILNGDISSFRNFKENYTTNFFARYTVLRASGYAYSDERYRQIRLRAAREVLSSFLFVGIVERMDDSWQLLRSNACALGLDIPDMCIPRQNVSEELRDDLSWIHSDDPVGRKLMLSMVEDRELYRSALDSFERQVAGRPRLAASQVA